MKKFYIHHHFTSIFVIALLATFVTILYYTEVAPVEANPVLTPTPNAVTLTATSLPLPTPGNTTGIVLWGFVIVAIIFSGLIFSRRSLHKQK